MYGSIIHPQPGRASARSPLCTTGTMLTPRNLQIANELMQWAREYLMSEHELMKRPAGKQTVCPFARASLENNSLYMEFYDEVAGHSEEQIERIMLDCIPRFLRLGPFAENDKLKKALLIVFPNLPDNQSSVLDIAHANIKSEFVQQGLMAGQFHPKCDERCIYNPAFKVSVAKYPLMAVRHMALHDILFLGNNPDWFNHYNLRYGHRFNHPETLEDYNTHLVRYYEDAKRRFLRDDVVLR
jgi:hypothetical protein